MNESVMMYGRNGTNAFIATAKMMTKIMKFMWVKAARIAVLIAKTINLNANVARNVAQLHAFAALFVETCASIANAGLYGFFRIS